MKENKDRTISKKQKGFTLIELMIVVLIIGILSGIMLAVINIPGIQSKARDARRIGDIKKLQTVLELFFSDNRGYPTTTPDWLRLGGLDPADLRADALPYINKIPQDPKGGNAPAGVTCFDGHSNYDYYYISNPAAEDADLSGKYVLGTILEVPRSSTDSDLCKNLSNCMGGTPSITCNCDAASGASETYCYGVENPL
jgi:general secretion pathway protein G